MARSDVKTVKCLVCGGEEGNLVYKRNIFGGLWPYQREGRSSMNRCICSVGLAIGLGIVTSTTAFGEVTFDWATIGNAGNAADPFTGFGTVANDFRMATTEVTNAQYAEFLNSVAATDSFGGTDPNLYNPNMANSFAGITQSGSAGSFTYAVTPGRENNPAVYTSFIDAMRFTNWLHNGQGAGDTETGVYNITDGTTETRAPGAQYFLPSEDEWYKGAYHQPAAQGGDSDDYWLYPESGNSVPVAGVDANFGNVSGDTTPVGTYAANFYGLLDMGGNVWEWNTGQPSASLRGLRGGSWLGDEFYLRSSSRVGDIPSLESFNVGFRVASPVPGPASGAAVVMFGGIGFSTRRRRHG